ncbi:hypothetical protein [Flexivirga alba]|uniref:Uracil-DNA glycosylase-like domain-containing protein n=1 Tax=Flexivirga alba TaxID=702742 RepID=A0ABW2AIF9_9MICO
MRTNPDGTDDSRTLFDELLDLVPTELYREFGEVFYSGATSFEQPSMIYLLGFNPGGDPSKAELGRYTIASDLEASRRPERRDWSGFEDDWRDFGPGAVSFQRRVRHLISACGVGDLRKVPSSNAIFVRSARIESLDAQRTKTLLRDCWAVHEKVISALGVRVVVCFGRAAGEWIRAQVGANGEMASDTFTETNERRWRSTTHHGRDGIQVVTLSHPSVADWTNPRSDPTGLVVRALERAGG